MEIKAYLLDVNVDYSQLFLNKAIVSDFQKMRETSCLISVQITTKMVENVLPSLVSSVRGFRFGRVNLTNSLWPGKI